MTVAFVGMTGVRVYEPPASRLARRVPLLLTQKGEVAVASRSRAPLDGRCVRWVPACAGMTRVLGECRGAAGVTVLLQRSRERGNRSVVGRLLRER